MPLAQGLPHPSVPPSGVGEAIAPVDWRRYAIAGYALIVAAFGVAGA